MRLCQLFIFYLFLSIAVDYGRDYFSTAKLTNSPTRGRSSNESSLRVDSWQELEVTGRAGEGIETELPHEDV